MSVKHKVITTSDHIKLACRVYMPSLEHKGVVVIASAMGVSQNYYSSLAGWLAEEGFIVATFDYRGIGESLEGGLRGFKADLFDWVEDCSAVLSAVSMQANGKPIYWIGHSLGGQIVPLVENIGVVSKVVTVASGSGYWLENAWPLKRRVWWLWFVVVPIVLPIFGYFPGRRLQKVGDLPKGVMTQWRRWCLNPDYCIGSEGERVKQRFENVNVPIVSIAFEDDELMSELNIESLHGFYTNAQVKMSRIDPEEVGVSRIGHFGFFKEKFKESLWRRHLIFEMNC